MAAFNVSEAAVDTGLWPWEVEFYRQTLRPTDRIVVVGCGTGRDVIALARAGHTVDGIDRVPSVVDAARGHISRHGLNANVAVACIDAPAELPVYDVYIFSYYCYSLIRGRDRRVRALRAIAAAAPHARVLIVAQRGVHRRWSTGFLQLANRIFRSNWRGEPGDVFRLDERGLILYHHEFAPWEVPVEAREAGYEVTRVKDDEWFELTPSSR